MQKLPIYLLTLCTLMLASASHAGVNDRTTLQNEDDTYERIADDAIGVLIGMVDVLAKVEDGPSAEQANRDFMDLAKEADELGERIKKVAKPTEEQKKRLKEKHQDRIDTAQKRMVKELERIQKNSPELFPTILPGMTELSKSMQKLKELEK